MVVAAIIGMGLGVTGGIMVRGPRASFQKYRIYTVSRCVRKDTCLRRFTVESASTFCAAWVPHVPRRC